MGDYHRQNMVDIKAHPGVELQILPVSRSESPHLQASAPYISNERSRSRTPPPPYWNRSRDPSTEPPPLENDPPEHQKFGRLDWVFRLALFELFLGLAAVGLALCCLSLSERYCSYYTGAWVSAIYVVHGIAGLAASRGRSTKLLIGHLTLCAVTLGATAAAVVMSVHNWHMVGQPALHGAGTWNEYCIIHGANRDRIDYIRVHQNQYNFEECILKFKIGLSMNTALALIAVLQGLFTLASAILCCFKICGNKRD